ncbi:MAG: sigma-70 family RNA polymerase sigma factor [Acidobacteriaceae bacterium]|nr:sigma-70 family RNA polymerase sigma factor [Acidobacteriaceae bacterium]
MRAFERQISMAVAWMGHFVMEGNLLRQLVRDAKAGDAASFERIVILHECLVLRVAQRILLNGEDAKDAAQEVFIRLHRTLSRFDEEKDLGPWLYRLTVNVCRDVLRRGKRNVSLDIVSDSADAAPDPEQSAVAAQQYRIVLDALQELSPREREAVVLCDLEGRSTEEVAEILGSSETTVRSQLSTGRVKMKNYVTARLRRRK